MTNSTQCFKLGQLLPHGAIQEITDTINEKIEKGKLQFPKPVTYQLVYRTMNGVVRKMKPMNEQVVKEAKKILLANEIPLP